MNVFLYGLPFGTAGLFWHQALRSLIDIPFSQAWSFTWPLFGTIPPKTWLLGLNLLAIISSIPQQRLGKIAKSALMYQLV